MTTGTDLRPAPVASGSGRRPARVGRSGALGPLAADLFNEIRGEVSFDAGSRALYAADASNYRQVPIAVVVPADVDDLARTVTVCARHGVPMVHRGGGTSLAGQGCNDAVVVDSSKHVDEIEFIDPQRRIARVQPGVVLDRLREAAGAHGLTFGPDPSTHDRCTLGGMIGNDSCGVHSVMAGRTIDNVEALEILTTDGVRMWVGPTSDEELEAIVAGDDRRASIYRRLRDLRDREADEIRARFPDIPRRVSGFPLDALLPEHAFQVARSLVGTESTCVTILRADVRLVPAPVARSVIVLGYEDVYAAADDVPWALDSGPIGLEGLDDRLVEDARRKGLHEDDLGMLPDGRGWLIAEFGGDSAEEANERAATLVSWTEGRSGGPRPTIARYPDPADQERIWTVREAGLGATAMVPGKPDTWPGWEDSAVAPEQLGPYLRAFRALLDEHGYDGDFYGHFGDGCLHVRIDFDLMSAAGIARYRAFAAEAADLVVRYGGSLSGEHGDGQARGELLPRMFGDRLVAAFGEFKSIWDPEGLMNPGKVVGPARLDEHLRLGSGYVPASPATTSFRWPEDEGRFGRAVLRCVGVGECRRDGGGVMCPSFQATHDERHSTRGRAHLLHEMLVGEVVTDGWRSDDVREAMDLCLACKGCKSDCPVNVDMATYKAEFMSHHYAGRLRPRAAYSMGLIHWWAGLASRAPRLANLAGSVPGLSSIAKLVAGVAPERTLPRFADRTFRRSMPDRVGTTAAPTDVRRVVLWPDTFTEHFMPEIGLAAVHVLDRLGFESEIPAGNVCCGRPLYDWGFLGQARRLLRRTFDELGPALEDGLPIIVLEPSCASVFRDEAVNLFPDDPRAQALQLQTVTFAEFLDQHRDLDLPRLDRAAIAQPHCHQRSLLGHEAEVRAWRRLGISAAEPEAGCCGMAGAFGFERGDKFAVSTTLGERALLPAVRAADPATVVMADGFSCREQILQGTGRRALHLAEVVALALDAPDGRIEDPATATEG